MESEKSKRQISQSKHIFQSPLLEAPYNASSLIISTIIGISHTYHLRYKFSKDIQFKKESIAYNQFKKFKSNPKSKKLFRFLENKLVTLLTDTNLPLSGPYDLAETVNILADYYDIIIRIFEKVARASSTYIHVIKNLDQFLK